ncbi:MAG: helix-turn-helix domain-containing protein [Lentisphaerota bacterium]
MKQAKMKVMELLMDPTIPESKWESALPGLQGEDLKPTNEGFMSVKDAMAFLGGISRVHLWQCRIKKGLPSHTVGGRIVFSSKELSDWVMKGAKA